MNNLCFYCKKILENSGMPFCQDCRPLINFYVTKKKKYTLLFTIKELIRWYNNQNTICVYCNKNVIRNRYTIENSLTIDRIYNNTILKLPDLAICCYECNRSKNNKSLKQWIEKYEQILNNIVKLEIVSVNKNEYINMYNQTRNERTPYIRMQIRDNKFRCRYCKQFYEKEFMVKSKKSKYGIHGWCKQCHKNNMRERKYNHPEYIWALYTKNGHIKKNYSFNLLCSDKYIVCYLACLLLKNKYCQYCNTELIINKKNEKYTKNNFNSIASLERINNEQILNESNIAIICYSCNTDKGDRKLHEWIEYIKKILTLNKDI